MPEMLPLDRYGLRSRLAARPVSRQEYTAFVRATGRSAHRHRDRGGSASEPVTYVSREDAEAYCRWLGTQEGGSYRLPKMAELVALFGETSMEGISPEIWPQGDVTSLETGPAGYDAYYCEWTTGTEVLPQYGVRPDRVMASIFYPPWLRHGPNAAHVRASLDPAEGYSFVTFRVASD